MTLSNYSLISALYVAENGGLYKDVYFPIIKYSLYALFHIDATKEYYTVDSLYEFIQKKFGLKIPNVVLGSVIKTMPSTQEFSITHYGDGFSFRIEKSWNYSHNTEIDAKAQAIESSINVLESDFQEYLQKVDYQEQVTFLQFISDNTDDILGFFQDHDAKKVDERYAIITEFLTYLEVVKPNLYEVANQLFWGSIIAGFLKREDPPITYNDTHEAIEYYMDTALVMSLLDLSTEIKKRYADDLLEIINKSGGIPYVHPITVMEITQILQTVEQNKVPYPNTDIAAAYERRNLDSATLASIRGSLPKSLNKIGLSIFPIMSDTDLHNQIKNTEKDERIRSLSSLRIHNETSVSLFRYDQKNWKFNFREIHDVFMIDFVAKRRKYLKRETVKFVSLNSELIKFAKRQDSSFSDNLVHPHRIVIDLWMHNSISSKEIKPLTEAMTRCQLMQEGDARRKLSIVSRYYNEKSEYYNPEAYKAVLLSLYKKAQGVIGYIMTAEENEKSNNTESNAEIIRKACEEALDKEKDFQAANDNLLKELESHKTRIKALTYDVESLQIQLAEQGDILKERQSESQEREKGSKQEKDALVRENALLKKTIEFQQDLTKTREEIKQIEQKIKELEALCQQSISHKVFWIQYTSVAFGIIIVLGVFIYLLIASYYKPAIFAGLLTTILALASYFFPKTENKLWHPKRYYKEMTKEEAKNWKDDNPSYNELCSKRDALKNRAAELEKQIGNLR